MNLNKNSIKLANVLNTSETSQRKVIYTAIGYILAEDLVTEESKELTTNRIRLKLANILDPIVELAIVDYDLLKKTILDMVSIKIENTRKNPSVAFTAKEFGDLFKYPNYFTTEDIKNINNNILIFNSAAAAFNVWYEQTYKQGM